MFLGILAGLGAGALWAFLLLVPKVLTDYSAADIAFGRYIVFGLISAVTLAPRAERLQKIMTRPLFFQALGLSFLCFTLYYFALVGSVKFSGIVPASLIIGLLPVSIPLLSRDKVLRPRFFWASLALILSGLLILNAPRLSGISTRDISSTDWAIGLILATCGLGLWTVFALFNAKILEKHPKMDSLSWSSLLGFFALLTMLPLWLISQGAALSETPPRFLNAPYIFWMIVLGVGSSWLASCLWNFATRRIPTALTGQLIVSEVIFALIYNYTYIRQFPGPSELSASALLITGVIVGIRSFQRPSTAFETFIRRLKRKGMA